MRKILLFTIISFYLINGTNAQLKFTNYSNQNNINCLLEDGNRIWIGTTGGLILRNKGTGSLIASYTSNNGLSNNDVSSLALDVDGNLWVGTRMGISKYNGSSWTYYTNPMSPGSSWWITSLAFDLSGDLWVTSIGDVAKFDGANWTIYSSSNTGDILSSYIYCVAVDNANNKWITTNLGLVKFNNETWSIYNTTNSNIAYDYTYSLAIDPNNNIWVSYMSNAGVTKFDGTTWTTELTSTTVNSITSDASGNMWFGTGSGLFKNNGATWTNYNTSNCEILSNIERSVIIDAQGNKWIGSYEGLTRFDNTTWTNYVINNTIIENDVFAAIIDPQDNKWFATYKGLAKLSNNNSWTNYTFENTTGGLPSNQLYTLAIDNAQNIWVGTSNGIAKFNGTTWTVFLSGYQVNSIYIDPVSGVVWTGTTNGVYSYNGVTWNVHYTTTDGLIDNEVLCIDKDGFGQMWFATRHGLSRRSTAGVWTDFSFYEGYNSSDWIMSVKHDPLTNNIWIATLYQGAYEYNGSAWINYTAYNSGITDNMIYGMTIDNLGNKWFATYGHGISKFDGTNWENYNISKGLIGEFTRCIYADGNGNKWIGSTSGVSKATCVTPIVDFTNDTICYSATSNITTFNNLSDKVDATTKYEWDINNDGSVEYTTQNISNQFSTAGNYTVKLTAINDQCTSSIIKSVYVNALPQVLISASENITICDGTSIELPASIVNTLPSGSTTFTWSTGESSSNIFASTEGVYTVTVTNGNCAGISNQVNVTVKTPYNDNKICMVTVDSASGKNLIMWEKPSDIYDVQSYNIYKVIGTSYVLIDNVPFDAMSMYKDYSSYPESNYSRYAISAVDNCGNESDKSPYHQTINLISAYNPSSSSVGLIWNHYEDESNVFIPQFYYIYRGTTANNLQLYQSVDGIVTSYNDVAPEMNKYYRISVVKPDACYPSSSAKSTSGPFSQSISNVDENAMATSIFEYSNTNNINVYPNPFTEQTTISFENQNHSSYNLLITTITGELVRIIKNIENNNVIINRENLSSGIYIIELQGSEILRSKIIVY